ncbi:hypothetical protein EMCRGX_G002974 [Ephydatia muelleri]
MRTTFLSLAWTSGWTYFVMWPLPYATSMASKNPSSTARDASSANVILKAMAGSEWKAKLGLPIGPRKLVPWEMVPLSIQPQRHFQSTHLSVSSHHGVYSYGILLCEVTLREFPDPATLHEMISKVKAKHASWHHKKELRESGGEQEEAPLTLAYKGRESTLIAKKGHIEQYFTAKSVPLTDNEHDTAMQLLAQAWYNNLLPPLLANSLSFNKFIACISRGSFRMPGRSKLTELLDDMYAKMLLRFKALLQQSTSVSLTTDAAKMPTGDSYVAVTCHWMSTDWCLMSAVLGVSISNASHTAEEIVSLLNELGVKYTLDGRNCH